MKIKTVIDDLVIIADECESVFNDRQSLQETLDEISRRCKDRIEQYDRERAAGRITEDD